MLDTNFWKKYFKVYDVLNLFIPYQELLKTICDELDIKKGDKILEAGCGTGNLALKIKERGADVIGLDYSKEALEIYRQKDKDANLVLADLRNKLPFPDNFFDKIACNNTLYAIEKEKQLDTLKEFYRVLKPGGKIVLVNPKKGASPFKIYSGHIKISLKTKGIIKTFGDVTSMIIPTIKMFYFNYKIKKERGRFFLNIQEQESVIRDIGFSTIETKLVYGLQGILTQADKI